MQVCKQACVYVHGTTRQIDCTAASPVSVAVSFEFTVAHHGSLTDGKRSPTDIDQAAVGPLFCFSVQFTAAVENNIGQCNITVAAGQAETGVAVSVSVAVDCGFAAVADIRELRIIFSC